MKRYVWNGKRYGKKLEKKAVLDQGISAVKGCELSETLARSTTGLTGRTNELHSLVKIFLISMHRGKTFDFEDVYSWYKIYIDLIKLLLLSLSLLQINFQFFVIRDLLVKKLQLMD